MRLCSLVTSSSFLFYSASKTHYPPSRILCHGRTGSALQVAPLSIGRSRSLHHHGLYSMLQESDTTESSDLVELAVQLSLLDQQSDEVTPPFSDPASASVTESPLSPVFWTSPFKDLPSESILLLNMVAILWGSQHAIIKMVVQDSDAGPFTLLRFGLAALIASPYTPGLPKFGQQDDSIISSSSDAEEKSASVATTWRWGAEMGFWMFLGFSFQAIGLGFTTAQRSGFLLYLNVKFVPFLARILLGREISGATWISALTAFTGTALLAYSGGNGASIDLNVGDLWSIAAAATSAMFILRLERASSEVNNAAQLNSACLWVVTLLAAIWTVGQGGPIDGFHLWDDVSSIIQQHPWEMIYLSGVTTAFANWIQTKAQRDVSAERASVIYAMDPVYGAAFSYLLLGETLGGVPGWIGAGMITLAAATNAFINLSGDDTQDPDAPEQQPEEGALR